MNTPARLDTPLDRKTLGEMQVDKFAGLTFRDYTDATEFAKVVSHARHGLPAFLRGNAADCLIITTQALRWRLEPVWVMQNAYVTKSDAGMFNYNNYVFGAVLNASGLLKGRPRYTFGGQGDQRVCKVTATFKGESEECEYITPPLKVCRKNSQLWTTDPDQQLGYYAIRNFARRYIPELLGGVYSNDEFQDATQEAPKPAATMKTINEGLDEIVGKARAEQLKTAGLEDEDIEEVLEDMGEYAPSDEELPLEGNRHGGG